MRFSRSLLCWSICATVGCSTGAEKTIDGGADLIGAEVASEAGAGTEGEGYRQGPYLCCAKGDGIGCCAGEQQGFCYEYGGLYQSCREEGEEYEGKVICAHCCQGLERVASAEVISTDGAPPECSYAPPSLLRCVRCGDGTCGVGENACNCPADCHD